MRPIKETFRDVYAQEYGNSSTKALASLVLLIYFVCAHPAHSAASPRLSSIDLLGKEDCSSNIHDDHCQSQSQLLDLTNLNTIIVN